MMHQEGSGNGSRMKKVLVSAAEASAATEAI
jgi:hypothetical protein